MKLKFRPLTFQERLSRVEQELQNLRTNVEIVNKGNTSITYQVTNSGIKHRDCDGEILLFNKDGVYRALLDNALFLMEGDGVITVFDQNEVLKGRFGMDLTGKFFATKRTTSGDLLTLVADEDGLLIRDQNKVLGRVEVDSQGFLRFVPL